MQTAESLLRSKGYSAFSYADLAKTIGIRKASIHHHFPTKEDLGVAVVQAYVERVALTFDEIERVHSLVGDRLVAFAEWFMASAKEGRLPLCGALAAEMAVLPERLQALTRYFFQLQLRWLQKLLDEGLTRQQIQRGTDTKACSRQILSLLEGASFVDWTLDDHKGFDARVLCRIAGVTDDSRRCTDRTGSTPTFNFL